MWTIRVSEGCSKKTGAYENFLFNVRLSDDSADKSFKGFHAR